MVQTILSHPIFVETILPFVLVFTIVFAVLQKTAILGKEKRQIDAIVALVVGLLIISFGQATGIIVQLVPFLAVSLVIILVLMILLGMLQKGGEFKMPKAVNAIMITVIVIALVAAVMYITNAWTYFYDLLFIGSDFNFIGNAVFVLVIIGAMVAVILGAGKKDSGKD